MSTPDPEVIPDGEVLVPLGSGARLRRKSHVPGLDPLSGRSRPPAATPAHAPNPPLIERTFGQ
jgi:hypothetical protein